VPLSSQVLAETRLSRSFGRVARAYDDARPEYAAEALTRAAAALELDSEARVVDLAAGTGKLTRRLAERFAEVVAVEPDDEMRAVLEEKVPEAAIRAGTAELIPLADAFADAVFVADGFHWFDAPVALREIARVLREGGGIALLWNVWWSDGAEGTSDGLDPPLPQAARDLFDAVYVASGRAASAGAADDGLAAFATSPFGPLHEELFRRELRLTADEVVALYATVSSVASLRDREREDLMRRVRALLAGTYRLPITTTLLWARLRRDA
jgi:ubiquinone/menaquinone biosynthesis C-methylase UbiE